MPRNHPNQFVATAITAAFVICGCMALPAPGPGTGGGDVSDAPEIPPSSTFVLELSEFTSSDQALATSERVIQAAPGASWLFSAANVAVWNTVVVVTMAIPVAAFTETFDETPVRQNDGSWAWTASAVVGNATYNARLTALAVGGDINWQMFIERENVFDEVLWYTGTSNLLGTAGSWSLNHDPNDLTPFLEITWTRDPITGTGTIRYTNIVEGGALENSYINAAFTTATEFDATYAIFDSAADNLTEIEWNRTSSAGRVRDERQFEDDAWHCWDELLQDVDCME